MKTLLTTPLLFLAACGAPTIDASARYGYWGLDGNVLTDTSLGAQANDFDSLGLGDREGAPGARADFKWGMPHLTISSTDSEFGGTGLITSEIELGGDTISVGAMVESDVKLGVDEALLTWDFAPTGAVEFGLGFGVVLLDMDMRFHESLTSTTASTDETLPFPVVALRAGVQSGSWEFEGSLAGFDVEIDDDAVSFFDLDVFGRYHFAGGEKRGGVSLLLGYRALDLSVDYTDGGDSVDADAELSGPYLGLQVSF